MVAQLPMHSLASQYGQLSRASELTKNSRGLSYEVIKKFGQEKLDEITSGKFVEEWEKDKKAGYATFKSLFEDAENSPMILEEQKFLKLLGRI
jgi:ketol-acid reductoisomerase